MNKEDNCDNCDYCGGICDGVHAIHIDYNKIIKDTVDNFINELQSELLPHDATQEQIIEFRNFIKTKVNSYFPEYATFLDLDDSLNPKTSKKSQCDFLCTSNNTTNDLSYTGFCHGC